MDVTPLIDAGQQVIQSYRAGGFRINGQLYTGPVIVFPDRTINWPVTAFAALTSSDFAAVNSAEIDVILLGAGARGGQLPGPLRTQLKARGLSCEVMDTGAACRTYNVLLADGRRIAAALLPL